MEKNVPTIMKSLLQSCLALKLPYPILPYSTLNQKFNIQASATLNNGEYPSIRYAVLGIGGLKTVTGADNFSYLESYQHSPADTGLFQELPFLVRPVNSDISDVIRAKYRLRKLITIGGADYFAYYAKVLNYGNNTPTLQTRTVQVDGTWSVDSFAPSTTNLNPQATILITDETVTTTGSYVSASTQLDFTLDANDVLELLNASVLIYGDENHAVISEVALCSGVDRTITANTGGITAVYDEAIAVQVMSFMSTNFPTPNFSTGIRYSYDIGNSEPLLVVS